MTSRKNNGGPKTDQGKARVSKNAIKHGLTTMRPADDNEYALVQGFAQELNDFYKPNNPLELFQIERIAICRAKLDRLYEVERVRLQLAQQALLQNPKQIIDQLTGIPSVTRGMLLEQIKHGQVRLPCALEPSTLKEIVIEIKLYLTQKVNQLTFEKGLPSLVNFLNSVVTAEQSEQANLESALNAVSARLEEVIKNGDKYYEHYYPLIKQVLLARQNKKEAKSLEALQAEEEIESYIQIRQEQLQVQRSKHLKQNIKSSEPTRVSSIFDRREALMERLELFIKLWEYYQALDGATKQFELTSELMLKAISLPAQESDLFMRYQTTLERRLSGAIGELLELQKLKTYLPR